MGYPYSLDDRQYDIGKWGEKTFPDSTQESIIAHLKDEVNNELGVDCNPDEYADVVMLIMHLCHKRGLSLQDLIRDKFDVVKRRKWNTKKNEKGFWEHVK